jgi:hypothetical protein
MAALNQNLDRAFDSFELTPANEISFLHAYKKTLRKCCIDPLRPPRFSEAGFLVSSGRRSSCRRWIEELNLEGGGIVPRRLFLEG